VVEFGFGGQIECRIGHFAPFYQASHQASRLVFISVGTYEKSL